LKVLVADAFERSGIDGLAAIGCEVAYDPELSGASLAERIRREQARVLVVRSTRVDAIMLEGSAVGLVVRAGAGLNTIDVEGARRLGIDVANCPGLNAIAVAELTLGLIIALDRRIPESAAELRAGRWNKKEFSKARGLYGRTLGLLGFGQAGQEVARRAQAFGMDVLVWSRRFGGAGPTEVPGVTVVGTPGELAVRSDVLSIHVALTPDTRGLVGRDVLERLKPGAYLVNTARAEVVDQEALADAVRTRGLRVALDVYAAEPPQSQGPFSDPLLALPNVIGTHHVGGSTEQAQEAIAQEVVRIVQHWRKHDHHDPNS
jgi:D-3-phosphoglycerate dehydrogenase